MNDIFIYALRDPRDGKVFYVGKSARIKMRFSVHRSARPEGKNPLRRRKILELREQGFSPMLHILESCTNENWQEREIFWIAEFGRLGHPLCNSHIGGFGWPHGVRQNPLTVARRAEANRGKKRSEEVKERTRQSNLRTWANPELRKRHKKFGASGDQLKKVVNGRRSWWMSLPLEERTRRAKVASDAARKSCGNKNWLMSLTPEERHLRALTASEAAKAVNRKVHHASV